MEKLQSLGNMPGVVDARYDNVVASGIEKVKDMIGIPPKAAPQHVNAGEDYSLVRRIARISEHHQKGNCGEKAAIAAIRLADRGAGSVEVYLETKSWASNHAFVVIGRDPNSNHLDPKTWGPTAVVVDPWKNKTFPASQLTIPSNVRLTRMFDVAHE